MGWFSRGKKSDNSEVESAKPISEVVDEGAPQDVVAHGPKDSQGAPAPEGYIDLGALYVPPIEGLQLRAQFEPDGKTLRRILLLVGTSAIQVSIAAAPQSGGVWDELREQIADAIRQTGGQVEEISGKYGQALEVRAAVKLPDGSTGFTPLQILGIEGPRWLARIDLQGAAAAGDKEQMELCEGIIDSLIVNRGREPRIRMEMLPMSLPQGMAIANEA